MEFTVQEDKQLVSKSMDCLRILTTGNEANKEALFQIPSSLSTLLRHMNPDSDLVGPLCSCLSSGLQALAWCREVWLFGLSFACQS